MSATRKPRPGFPRSVSLLRPRTRAKADPMDLSTAAPVALIVDDDQVFRTVVRAYLEDEGMDVRGAGSAEEALALVREGTDFDVCIMDMRLPGMDGNSAIQALHQMRPDLRFIIHTGSLDYALTEDLERLGIRHTHLFKKPLTDMSPLAATIRQLAGDQPT